MKRSSRITLSLAVLMLGVLPAKSCLVYYYYYENRAFGATNKDWNNLNTAIRVLPSAVDKYGIVYFGYNIQEGFQNVGGINEHGLWYDGASLPSRSDIANYNNKPEYKGELCEEALETCTNVHEVIELYAHYYTPHWQGHVLWGDRDGNSVIIEFGDRDVVFLERTGSFQLITNHYLLDSLNTRWISCRRFQTAEEMLKDVTDASLDEFSGVLEATLQTGFTPTLYSNVYDLSNRIVYIYNYHYYKELVRIDVAKLLAAGNQNISIPDLFHKIVITEPQNHSLIEDEYAILSWTGNSGTYGVMISKDPGFKEYTMLYEETKNGMNASYLLLPFLSPLLLLYRFKRNYKCQSITLSLSFILLLGFVSCSKLFFDPYPDSDIRHQVRVSDLEPDTTYYWKVICKGDSQIASESICYSFTTYASHYQRNG